MFHRLLFMGLPALIGFGVGFIFTWQVAMIMVSIACMIAGGLAWSTRNDGLGSVIGTLAVIIAVSAAVGLVISFAIVYGWSLNLSWLIRPGVLT